MIKISRLKPQQIMQLQRQLGNQATMQIINRKQQDKSTGQPFAGLKMVQRKGKKRFQSISR